MLGLSVFLCCIIYYFSVFIFNLLVIIYSLRFYSLYDYLINKQKETKLYWNFSRLCDVCGLYCRATEWWLGRWRLVGGRGTTNLGVGSTCCSRRQSTHQQTQGGRPAVTNTGGDLQKGGERWNERPGGDQSDARSAARSSARYRSQIWSQRCQWTSSRKGWHKPNFHLALHVTSRLDTTRHVRRVEPMHFGCVELVEQRGSTRSSRHARHIERVVSGASRRDVTWRAKCNLGYTLLHCAFSVPFFAVVFSTLNFYHVKCLRGRVQMR